MVRDQYGAIAESTLSSEHAGVHRIAEAFGYSAEDLASIPAEANMGSSCGNPTATANLDRAKWWSTFGLGGGGLDVFLASRRKSAPTGKAIGIDMTPAMLERARANASKQGLTNVEFHESTIDTLPLADSSVDCVISNCVINLAPIKGPYSGKSPGSWKPGGRVASFRHRAANKMLPPEVEQDLYAYVGCIAGAILIEVRARLKAAGFSDVEVIDTKKDLNAYGEVEGKRAAVRSRPRVVPRGPWRTLLLPARIQRGPGGFAELLKKFDINAFAASVQVYAIKPL